MYHASMSDCVGAAIVLSSKYNFFLFSGNADIHDFV